MRLPFQKKICQACKKRLPVGFFRPDEKCKDGYRPRCKPCARMGLQASTIPIEKREPVKRPRDTKDYSKEIAAAKNAFQMIRARHQCPFALSSQSDGKFRLQTHGIPNKTWTSQDFDELLTMALR